MIRPSLSPHFTEMSVLPSAIIAHGNGAVKLPSSNNVALSQREGYNRSELVFQQGA
jgi:hypothetical protein